MLIQGLPTNALQAASYARIRSELADVSVYDEVPEDAAYPYIRLGGFGAVGGAGTKRQAASSVRGVFHVLSSYKGDREANSIMDRILVALTSHTWAVEGYQVLSTDLDSSLVYIEPDGLRHGVLEVIFEVFRRI
jgi:hypothetical protein